MNLSLEEISKAVGGTLEGPGNMKVRGYSIDSRTLTPGELFFAIKGPRFDGHQFVAQAFKKGAAAAVVEENSGPGDGPATIRVPSTLEALQTLARDVRRRWGMTIIGVTGSAGKTTTKEMIAAVLGKKFTVLRSVGNLNNEFGLPLCLLRAERYQNIGVLEMGMSAKGEIRKLASIAEPNEGVVTNVNPVHLEFFKSVDEIAEAKAELLEGLHEPKVAYLNNDDPRVRDGAQLRRESYYLRREVRRSIQSPTNTGSGYRRNRFHRAAWPGRCTFRFAFARPAQCRQCDRRHRRGRYTRSPLGTNSGSH